MSSQNYVNADGVVLALTSTATSPLTTVWGATGANQTLYGNSGNDDFVIFDPTDKIVIPATHGIYTVSDSAWDVSYTLPTGINNLIVNGDLQVVSGNAQANLIETGAYRSTVSGGGGDDVFVLSTGAVTVVDPQGSGSDVIYGFNTAIDHVRLDGTSVFTSWASIQAALTQSGSDAVLNMGNGQTLTFRNMNVSAFSANDFYYPVPTQIMSQTFDSEFSSFVSSSNGSVGWMTSWPYGGVNNRAFPGGQDSSYYSDSSVGYNPFKVVNGVLDITATTAAAAGGNPDNLPYDSGVITTYKSESQLYGYFEIRAETPAGQGLWPAFYFQSDDGSAELDVFEILGQSPTNLYVTATDHATNTSVSQLVIIPDASAGFHTYGVDWEPDTITFYVDGYVVATTPTPASMHTPMYMVVGLAVGASGSWAGPASSSAEFPATLQVDYVRAYATAATQDVAGTAAIAQPISVTPATGAVTSTNGASVHPFTAVGISDINASQTETATVTLSSLGNGVLSDPNAATDGSKVVNGAWTVMGSAAAVAAALDGLVFTPTAGQTVPSVATTVTATIKDTAGETVSATSTITATATAPQPISVTPPTEAVTSANGASVNPFAGVAISDGNIGQTETATVTLSSPGNGVVSDPNTATDGSKVVSGAWTVTGSAAAVATALDGLVFTPAAGQTVPSITTVVTATVQDTAGQTGTSVSTVIATAVLPISVTPPTEAATSANGASVNPFTGVAISDGNIGQTETATVALGSPGNGVLSDPNTATDGSKVANGVWTVTGSAAAVATALDGLVFAPAAGQTVPSVTTTVTATVQDTAGQTVTSVSTVTATAPASSSPGKISSAVLHSGAPTDAAWGTGEGGVTVSLLNAAGVVVATAVTANWGGFTFGSIGPGAYRLQYTPPVGQGFKTGAPENPTTGLTAQFTVAAGQTVNAPQGWLVSNTVNGSVLLSGVAEAGVTVSLLTTAGAAVATTTTGSTGAYTFTGMAAGSYKVAYTPPSGQAIDPAGPEAPTTGQTAPFTVAAGQTVTAPTGALVTNSVVGTVLLDGVAEAGVTVSLLTTGGAVAATATSDSNGAYTFTSVPTGSYQVAYTTPSGQNIDPTGPEDPTTGLTAPFTVGGGQTTAPTGELVTNSIAGAVTADGAAEAGVTVSLLNAAGDVLATTTTGSNGGYLFTGLAAGSYEAAYTAPAGQVFQAGSAANATTGITPIVTLANNQALALATEQLLSNPGTISSAVLHYGATTDVSWGTGEGGVTVSLLNAAGTVIATTVTPGWGGFKFSQIGAGTYQLQYTAPAGQSFKPGSPADPTTGLTAQFTVAAGQSVTAPQGWLMSTIVMNGTNQTEVAPAGAYLVTGNAGNSTLTLGSGSQYVTLTGGNDTVATGSGSQTITLSGTGNTVTVGVGTSTINAGSGQDTVHAAGGHITITATGGGNLFDSGPGLNFLNADGSANNVFMLNPAAGSQLTTIAGFNPAANDILDLKRTLAGANILPDLSNVGSLVTAAFSGGNTVLYAAPTGGGTPLPFAVLAGVNVTVAQLQAAHEFSLS